MQSKKKRGGCAKGLLVILTDRHALKHDWPHVKSHDKLLSDK